ncbi:MAG: endonuclease V [Thermotogae bacterium]|nr:endonuclease V [Thermotogota bacterium]
MEYRELHRWDLEPPEAMEVQNRLKERLLIVPFEGKVEYVAGVDLSFPGGKALAVIVVINAAMKVVEVVHTLSEIEYPYIPGLLAFREGPAFLKTWEKLKTKPDVVFFDGQGIAHPRGLGIASHMGLFIDIPTVGIAKSRLYGKHEEPGKNKGDYTPLFDERGNKIGFVLRSRPNVAPLYVSPGHLTDPDSALKLTMRFLKNRRLPEPTRLAHLYTQKLKGGLMFS